MKIMSSTLQMQAQHSASRVQMQSTKLEMWVGQRPTGGGAGAAQAPSSLRISEAARQAAAAAPAASPQVGKTEMKASRDEHLKPPMILLRDLIERMTGVVAQITDLQSTPVPSSTQAAPASEPAPTSKTTPAQQTAARSAGFGLVMEQHNVLEESEHTQFAAQGTVRTADGQELRFTLELSMQRSYREESWSSLRLGDAAKPVDPLVVNFDGTAAELQSMRFAFDLNGDGATESVPLLAGNRGYLALDRNQNDRIDNGLELFGPGSGNGFEELAQHDDDGNGWIDENDTVFNQLRVWTPSADGVGQLRTLQEVGVGALHLASVDTPFALRGEQNSALGAIRSTSIYLREDGGAGTVQQIDLAV